MGAIYNFIGLIIASDGLGAQTLGPLVALGLVASLVGALLPSILGGRVQPVVGITVASVAIILAYPAMLSHALLVFSCGFVAHAIFGTLGYTYYLGAVRHFDFTNRIYIAYGAFQSVGLAGGTALAGFILGISTPMVLFGYAACFIIASWLAFFAAERLSVRFQRS
jgi:hypothetical protein